MAYPMTDGVIDTIQWEGYREGVNDIRYLATLDAVDTAHDWDYLTGCIATVLGIYDDPRTIRQMIADKILYVMDKRGLRSFDPS